MIDNETHAPHVIASQIIQCVLNTAQDFEMNELYYPTFELFWERLKIAIEVDLEHI